MSVQQFYGTLGDSAGAAIKGSRGRVFSISCSNRNAATRWFQLFDSANGPSGAPVSGKSFPVFAGGVLILDQDYFGQDGLAFSAGISWGFSSTALTYTAASGSDAIVDIRYL